MKFDLKVKDLDVLDMLTDEEDVQSSDEDVDKVFSDDKSPPKKNTKDGWDL